MLKAEIVKGRWFKKLLLYRLGTYKLDRYTLKMRHVTLQKMLIAEP